MVILLGFDGSGTGGGTAFLAGLTFFRGGSVGWIRAGGHRFLWGRPRPEDDAPGTLEVYG